MIVTLQKDYNPLSASFEGMKSYQNCKTWLKSPQQNYYESGDCDYKVTTMAVEETCNINCVKMMKFCV